MQTICRMKLEEKWTEPGKENNVHSGHNVDKKVIWKYTHIHIHTYLYTNNKFIS